MEYIKTHKLVFIVGGITIAVSVIGLFIAYLVINTNSRRTDLDNTGNSGSNTPLSNPVSSTINDQSTEDSAKKYINPDGIFEYSYPVDWTFRTGREGIGLIPVNLKDNPLGEIVTIFTRKANQGQSLVDWAKEYDGVGYQTEKEIVVNGYSVYYIFKESPQLTMEIYTFKHGDNIVRINFRKKDNASTPNSYDFSKYEDDFQEIVNSIKFL